MISTITPNEILKEIAIKAKLKRLSMNLSQKTLSIQSGVSYGVIKKFESEGQISLKSLLKLALVLDALEDFKNLFTPKKPQEALSLDELIKTKSIKRGRK